MIPGSEQVKELYDLARSSVSAREEMKISLSRGLVQQYHHTLREHPEAPLADALLAVRRLIGDLTAERRKVTDRRLPPEREDMELQQINQAIAQTAAGTLMWAKEWMAGFKHDDSGSGIKRKIGGRVAGVERR